MFGRPQCVCRLGGVWLSVRWSYTAEPLLCRVGGDPGLVVLPPSTLRKDSCQKEQQCI